MGLFSYRCIPINFTLAQAIVKSQACVDFSDTFTTRSCAYILVKFGHALSLFCKKLFMRSRSVAEICSRGLFSAYALVSIKCKDN